MLISLAYMLILGMFTGWVCKKMHLPPLLGMIFSGIMLKLLGGIDSSVLDISAQLRKIALIIILARAGLSLNISDLKKAGRPALMMCFVPACFEIFGMLLLAPPLLGVSLVEAGIIGSVVAAVSPAVIVPKMIKLIQDGYGNKKSIPQMILAGASIDDVFVIVLFSSFTSLAQDGKFSILSLATVPVSILLGIAVGGITGFILSEYFDKMKVRDTIKVLVIMSVSFIFVTAEDFLTGILPFSSLIAVMFTGMFIKKNKPEISGKLNEIWIFAEIMLFVLVGAEVDLKYAVSAGISAVILILGVLVFRMTGVYCCMLKTRLNLKERLFCMLAYIPKATVQAAIGGLPLSMGLGCGNTVLTCAVLSILITAPLGAFLIESTYKKLLTKE